MPYVCMGLVRFIGGIFFVAASVWVFSWLNDIWHLGVNQMVDIQTIGGKAYLAMFIALLAGLMAGVVGQTIGASIKIESDDNAALITMYWHYFANYNIAWFLIIPFGFLLILGQDGSKPFFKLAGNNFISTLWV